MLATWFVWGSTYLAIKFALVSFPPYFQMGTRFVVAGGLLFAWAHWVRKEPLPDLRQWRNALVVGTLMLGGGMGGTATAEQTIGSGLVVAFIASSPLSITLINRLFGVRPRRAEIIGTLVGFAGVLLLIQGAEFRASPRGLLAIASAVLCWGFGSVLSQRRLPLAPGSMGYASEMLCGAAVLMSLSWIRGEVPQLPPDPLALAAWAYLVVFGSLVAFNAYMVLLSRTTVAISSSYAFVNPIIALLLGVWLGGESISAGEWVAGGIVLCGVAIILWSRVRASTAA